MSPAFPNASPFRNHLLAALSAEDVEHLRPHMQHVTLVLRQTLHEPGERVEHVYLLEEGIASLTADTGDTGFVEVGMTGREGMVGVAAVLGADAIAVHRAVTQVPGHAIRMRTAALRDAMDRSAAFRDRCLRYVQFLLVQASQSSACNARHEVTERLARWLLMSHDRLDGDEMPMTQDFLALMLGVRRTAVSLVATALASTGAIRQSRGRLVILDREGLEAEACNCYRVIKDAERRLMLGVE